MGVVYTNTRGRTRLLNSLNVVALEYVHAEPDHVRWEYAGKAIAKQRKYTPIDNALRRYTTELRNQLEVIDAKGVNILRSIDDETLVYLMEELAKQADELSQESFAGVDDSLLTSIGQAYSGKNAIVQLVKGNSQSFDVMMDGIYKALHEVSSLTPQQWAGFRVAYAAAIRGDTSQLEKVSGILSGEDVRIGGEIVKRVTNYLKTISHKLEDGRAKSYTASQMAGTLKNAMGAVGEQLQAIKMDMIIDRMNECDNAVELVGAKTSRSRTGFQGGRATTSKVDIVNKGGLQISSISEKLGNGRYLVRGQLNSSVKWYNEVVASKNAGGNPNATFGNTIEIATSTNYINWIKRVFGSSISSMYGVYNTLAFANTSQGSGYAQIIKASVIQEALDLFLAGKGTSIFGSASSGIDLSALFVLNGRVYSVASIMAAAVSELQRNPDKYGSNSTDLVYMTTKGDKNLDNKWEGEEGVKNLEQAFARSEKIKKQINKINFSVQLNPNSLMVLFPRLNVKPII